MNIELLLKTALKDNDRSRERSQQTQLGASSVGGCRRQAFHILNATPKTNHDTENLAAIIGTSLHATIAEAMKKMDVFGDDFLIEQEFNTPDLKGHCDLFIKSTGTVIDWKTTSKKNIASFPSDQQRMQVQLYGYLIEEAGHKVNEVCLVAITRDGTFGHTKVHKEPYDREMALQGIEWIKDIQGMTIAPEPEKPRGFCRSYCEWYDESGTAGCPAK